MSNILPSPFDIETGPRSDDELLSIAGEFNADDVALGNTKDPAKIEEKIEAARLAYPETLRSRACLDPILGKVMAIGIITPADRVVIFDGHANERAALGSFWKLADELHKAGHGFEGWNIFGFDLDFLRIRSMLVKVAVPAWVASVSGNFLSYRRHFTDLMLEVTGSPKKYLKLHTFCRAIGLEGKTGNGADFWKEWTSPDAALRVKAEQYLVTDLRQTQGAGLHIREFRNLGLMVPGAALAAPLVEEDVPYEFPVRPVVVAA